MTPEWSRPNWLNDTMTAPLMPKNWWGIANP